MSDHPAPTGPPNDGSDGSDPTARDSGKSSGGLLSGRALLAAAAVGIGVVAAVVIVSLTTDTEDGDPANAEVIAAEDSAGTPDTDQTDTDTAGGEPDDSGAARAADLGAAASVGEFDVALRTDPDGLVRIDIEDPETPSLSDQPAQHCVLVNLEGESSVEAYGCVEVTDGTAEGTLTLGDPQDAKVGCAAVATNTPVDAVGSQAAASSFVVAESTPLAAGSYELSVSAVSGVGDGCEPADGPTERITTTTADLQLG